MTLSPRFIVDSNIFIESKRVDYGFDICPGFWDLLRKGFDEGLIIGHNKVYKELSEVGDRLSEWIEELPRSCFPKETNKELSVYLKLCSWARRTGYKQSAIDRFCELDYADPWICAKAKVMGLILVTQEVSQPLSRKDVKLPDACKAIDVPYCNKYAMLRELRASFVLDSAHSFNYD